MSNTQKEYWIMDGVCSAYDLREEIKRHKGYFVKGHKCWAIKAPSDDLKMTLKCLGLRLQFRRNLI